MAVWVKDNPGSGTPFYWNSTMLMNVFVASASDGSPTFSIYATTPTGVIITMRSGFATQVAAQAALDTAITNLGGSL